MTATITFDTLAFVTKLEGRGFTVEQATGISDALKDVVGNTDLASKADLKEIKNDLNATRADLKAEIEKLDLRIKAEIAPLKWITGVMAAGIISLVMKTFF